ncbi:response regulator [Alkaliphilus sp. B6464]|uniref:response regulator n=1 Tax=Alkaliphilus sp. B6464 TaxID=2731219 RepID=UPI001BA54D94|nr:response regulator [Alkaliphilus sp. B6464]QUH20120.1 SpoIIE family protein phosphatase [Alkaliphilus sp. B6464]
MITYKILILDFGENSSTDMKNLLRKHGYEVVQRSIEDSYIENILKEMPHIVLINCFSDDKKTIKVCNVLKKDEYTRRIPIITTINSHNIEQKKKCISLGIDDYITYPLEEEDFILRIKNQTKLIEVQRQLTMCQNALEESLDMVEKQKNELEINLSLASKIQEALIPKSLGNIPNCSFTWTYQPSGRVGGDIFDVFMLDDDHLGLYMIDVMGHGVASSMLAVTLSETLILDVDRGSPLKRKINYPPYYEIISPLEVVNYLNKRFPFVKYNHYFTIFYMVLNIKTGVMKYVRAGHPTPLLVKDTGKIIELDAYGTPVGFEFSEGYEEKTVYFDSGDSLIIYTDGLMEVKDEAGNPIEYEGIVNYIQRETDFVNGHLTMELNKLVRSQSSLKDDLSILEMRWIKFI